MMITLVSTVQYAVFASRGKLQIGQMQRERRRRRPRRTEWWVGERAASEDGRPATTDVGDVQGHAAEPSRPTRRIDSRRIRDWSTRSTRVSLRRRRRQNHPVYCCTSRNRQDSIMSDGRTDGRTTTRTAAVVTVFCMDRRSMCQPEASCCPPAKRPTNRPLPAAQTIGPRRTCSRRMWTTVRPDARWPSVSRIWPIARRCDAFNFSTENEWRVMPAVGFSGI